MNISVCPDNKMKMADPSLGLLSAIVYTIRNTDREVSNSPISVFLPHNNHIYTTTTLTLLYPLPPPFHFPLFLTLILPPPLVVV